ncbi:hypothetical protein [Bacillus sp. 179-C3.3 HS]|uniref:hypothetical protein n=1 Tax=Bacillus sp. 179-C3.3 HS TaxID=3232162 RepID=UPI0039A10673
MRKWTSWLRVWFGFIMNVLVKPDVMLKQQGFGQMAVDSGFFQAVRERHQEKLIEDNQKKRRVFQQFKRSLMMLYEMTTREARAGPVLPLQKR